MRDSQKAELRADIRELVEKGYSKNEAVETLVDYGYVKSTASRYWDVFSVKYSLNLKTKEKDNG